MNNYILKKNMLFVMDTIQGNVVMTNSIHLAKRFTKEEAEQIVLETLFELEMVELEPEGLKGFYFNNTHISYN